MFGLSMGELLIILVVVVVLFGSTRLAGLGKSAGKSVREFKEELHKDDNTNKAAAEESKEAADDDAQTK
ncbi:MAG: twin-arginine translocase TatA/TatE family subunit [Peptococcaceae bacterium]|nr:twin-arginine translocase TatA/TatE family subunit [Peptococcaceae bacterium]